MLSQLRTLYRDEQGATAVEYGLMALLIMLVIILAVQEAGLSVTNPFNDVSGNL